MFRNQCSLKSQDPKTPSLQVGLASETPLPQKSDLRNKTLALPRLPYKKKCCVEQTCVDLSFSFCCRILTLCLCFKVCSIGSIFAPGNPHAKSHPSTSLSPQHSLIRHIDYGKLVHTSQIEHEQGEYASIATCVRCIACHLTTCLPLRTRHTHTDLFNLITIPIVCAEQPSFRSHT